MNKEEIKEYGIWVKPLYNETVKEMKVRIKRLEKENNNILDEICQDYIDLQTQLTEANEKLEKIEKYLKTQAEKYRWKEYTEELSVTSAYEMVLEEILEIIKESDNNGLW